jgi:hypothetical protein
MQMSSVVGVSNSFRPRTQEDRVEVLAQPRLQTDPYITGSASYRRSLANPRRGSEPSINFAAHSRSRECTRRSGTQFALSSLANVSRV